MQSGGAGANMIKFVCSECGQSYRVLEKYAGRRVRCKGCGQVHTIPQPASETAGSGDSIIAINNLLEALSKAEDTEPTVEFGA